MIFAATYEDLQAGLRRRYGDDVAQNVAVELLKHPDLELHNPRGYILKIAAHLHINQLRKDRLLASRFDPQWTEGVEGRQLDRVVACQELERIDPRLILDGMGYDGLIAARQSYHNPSASTPEQDARASQSQQATRADMLSGPGSSDQTSDDR